MGLSRRRRNIDRYVEIGRVLARHGWEHLLGRLGLADLFRVRQQAIGAPPGPVQVRESLEELGPTFIKLGQLLSTRPDIVPKEYADELERLQDNAPPIPLESVYSVIQEEFGEPVDRVFATFDPEPLASASIGQTHLATLPDGREVVAKVQRPHIIEIIEADIEILSWVACFLEQHFPQTCVYGLPDLVDEFSITIHQEMDYTREGRNGDRLRENFKDIEQVRIAETIWDYTTMRVLTMERLCGVKISDIEQLDAHGYDRKKIAGTLSRAFLKMILVDGLFHSDPHPGNLVVLEDNVLGILDYGQVSRMDAELRTQVTMLLAEYIQQDSAGFGEVLLDMGSAPVDLNRYAYTRDLDRLLRQYYDIPASEVQIGEMLRRSLEVSSTHHVRLPSNLPTLAKAIVEVEGADKLLDPNYNLTNDAMPYIERSVRSELAYGRMRPQILQNMLSWKNLLFEFPHRASEVMVSMAENRFRIIFHHEGLEVATRDIDRSANRLSFALMASAVIIGSALILASNVGPTWRGYSVVGVIGFGLSFLLTIWLLISIVRAGKLW